MRKLLLKSALAVLVAWLGLVQGIHAQSPPQLDGEQVAEIVRTFLRNHYSQTEFDDGHSSAMLSQYLDRFDPGHYYFLQSDVDEFQRFSTRLDDEVLRGNIDAAFKIFDRFRQRVIETEPVIARLLDGAFDLESEDSTEVDRKAAPYPANAAEGERLWRKKLKFDVLEQVLGGSTEAEAKSRLQRRYRSFRLQIERYTHNDVVTAWLNALTAAYDPHSSYLSPDDLENFNISLRLSLEGIGATLRWEDGMTVVSSIIPGGAAWREGSLKPEDRVVSVGQGTTGELEDVRNMRLIDVVKLIRGKRGTTVRLGLLRKTDSPSEKQLRISIVRDKIVLKEGEAKGSILEVKREGAPEAHRFGVIKLPSFYVDFSQRRTNPNNYKSSSRDVETLLDGFVKEQVHGVILDLRNNGGGGLDEAVQLSGLFLNRGPVVMVKNVRGRLSVMSNPHSKPSFQGPLVVVTNRYSASASEILAGALKDYGRAILVGERSTFGKGTVQNIIQLPRGMGALKTTVAKFYRPGSASTQNRGVVPDIVLPSLNNHLDIGESSLKNALPWDAVRKTAFQPWSDLSPYMPVIEARSRQRQLANPEFTKIRERVQEYLDKEKDRKVVTISEMRRRRQFDEPEEPEQKEAEAPPAAAAEDDYYLEEVGHILSDFIALNDTDPGKRVAAQKN